MTYWLKAFGLVQAPVEDDWKRHKDGLLTRTATFPRRSGVRPGDKLAELYLARCNDLENNPPGPEWDGVFVMKEK